jgi:hypothetical protein
MQALSVLSSHMHIDVPFSAKKLGRHIEEQLAMVAGACVNAELDRRGAEDQQSSRGIIF